MALSYGSITIVDVTDIGEFSVYPQCNLPLSVIYDPNESAANAYNPNWGTNNLIITPVVYYAGERLTFPTSGLSVVWKKQEGVNDAATITSGSGGNTITNGVLTVAQNQFSANSADMISYICTVTYQEPESSATLTAEGRITFTVVRHASKLKRCTISGENIFKYLAGQTQPVGSGEITLTAKLDNVTNGNWQYKNSSDSWTNFSTTYNSSINGLTIKVNAAETALFVNDVATIRKLTSDPSVFDETTVVKLRDGAPLRAISLSNEDQMIPCESDGTPTTNAFDQAKTTVTVYDGDGVATGWTYQVKTNGEVGVSGTWTAATRTYQVTSWTGASEVASVTFQATKGNETLEAVFTLTKIKVGADGTSPKYQELVCSAVSANRTAGTSNITWTPSTIKFSAVERDGATNSDYTGYVKIYKNDDSSATVSTAMTGTPPAYTYTIPAESTLTSLKVELYQTGGGGSILDSQTIALTKNGETGQQGAGASNVVLGNYNDTIPCNTDGTVKANTTIEIPFTGFKGTTRVAATITQAKISGLIADQITCTGITNATASASGKVTLLFAKDTSLGGSDKGTITLTFTVNSVSVPMTYSWAKSIQAADGINAVVFRCWGKNGDIIENDANNVILTNDLTDGVTTVTSGITYQWYQFNASASSPADKYVAISGATSQELTVTPSMVTGYASFKCVATYNSKAYSGYVSVRDKSDPIQVELFSSVGTQLLNSVGHGAVYARLFRAGNEIDTIKTTTFKVSTEAPAAGSNTYYYKLDTTNKTCILMKSNGTTWSTAPASDGPSYTYTWTFRNKEGNSTTYNGQSSMTGKAIYVDGSLIDKKIIFDCEVTETA